MTRCKYFDSQVFQPGNELSREEALQRGVYLACYYTSDESPLQPEWAEVTRHTETGEDIRRVIYYARSLPHTRLIHHHLAVYYGIPFDIVLPLATANGETIRTAYHYAADGYLRHIITAHWDEHHFLEFRKDADGNLMGSIESDYDGAGNLLVTREYDADGVMISEYEEDS